MSALTLWSQGEGARGSVAQVDCQGKVFSIFRIFIAPLRPSRLLLRATLPVDKLFSFCAASRFLMPPTSQTVAAPLCLPLPLWDPFVPLLQQVFQLIFAVLQQTRVAKANSTCLSLVCGGFFLLFSGNVAPTTCAPCCSCCCCCSCFCCCLDASLCPAIHRKV